MIDDDLGLSEDTTDQEIDDTSLYDSSIYEDDTDVDYGIGIDMDSATFDE